MNRTKLLMIWLLALIFYFLAGQTLNACDVIFKVISDEKETYIVGDEIIVLLTVKLTDRDCPVTLEQTEYKADGIKIKAATKWKQTAPDIWKRKLKLEVTDGSKDELSIAAVRTCEKEGGYGSFFCGSAQLNVSASGSGQAEETK